MKKLFLTLGLVFAFAGFTTAQVPKASEDVMLQGFMWNSQKDTRWYELYQQVDEIAESFDLIWLPPASAGEGGGSGNMGYHPYKYSDLNSAWGTERQLRGLIKALKDAGCKAIADVVINHKAGGSKCGDFADEKFGKFGSFKMPNDYICKDDESSAWGCKRGNNNDTGERYPAARDLDHVNTGFQKAITAYLNWLTKDVGFAGFRYDMTKGYSGYYNKIYNNAVKPYFSVGEYWDGNATTLAGWVNQAGKTSMTFDFAMKYAINEWGGGSNYSKLSWGGKPAGLVSRDDMREYAVTFIDNHDTATPHENPQEYGGDWQKANAFLLSAPGIPCVFWKHWNNASCKAAIKKMIAARKAVGLHSNSYVKVNSTSGYYECLGEGKKGKLICRIGNFDDNVPSGFKKACSGPGWAYYTTADVTPGIEVSMNPTGGFVGPNGKVTLTASKGATAYYTTDGSTPSASSTKYTSPIVITKDKTTVKAIAIQGAKKSTVISGIFYTVKPKGLEVKFKAPSTWNSCNLYAWTEDGTPILNVWPGQALQKIGGYYTYTITETEERPVNVIFNCGDLQTADLSTSTDACWDGSQFSGNKFTPVPCGEAPQPVEKGVYVQFKQPADWTTVKIYAWDGADQPCGEWPGEDMVKNDKGFYNFSFPNKESIELIFNNGNDKQTVNLVASGKKCFDGANGTDVQGKLKPGECTYVGVEEAEVNNFMIYPNPTTGLATIISEEEISYVIIRNLAGRTVGSSITNEVDMSGLAPSMYLVEVLFDNGTSAVRKVIRK